MIDRQRQEKLKDVSVTKIDEPRQQKLFFTAFSAASIHIHLLLHLYLLFALILLVYLTHTVRTVHKSLRITLNEDRHDAISIDPRPFYPLTLF